MRPTTHTQTEFFRSQVNDDKDGGDVAADGSDVPGQADGNFLDGVVNGRCDLADFFPVCLNVSALFAATGLDPLTVLVRLRQADGAVNAVWTGLAPEDAGMFQRGDVDTCGEACTSPSYSAASVQVTPGGVTLPPSFLLTTLFYGFNGVVMVEGRKPTAKPLVMELLSQGSVVCRALLPLSISSVENMFRCVNLRNMINQGSLPEPSNNPDAISNGKNLVFLHGYQPASAADLGVHDWHKA